MAKKKPYELVISETGSRTSDEIFLAVGKALSAWEYLETTLALSFGHLVGTNHIVALRAIGRIESPAARLNVILEAFRSSPEEFRAQYPTFEKTVKEVMPFTEVRNAIAHGHLQWIEIKGQEKVYYLTPSISTTRKTTQIDRVDQGALVAARNEAEVLRHIYEYALNADAIDGYRLEFKRLLEEVQSCNFPSAQFDIRAK